LPVLEQAAGCPGDADIATLAPLSYPVTYTVNERVFLLSILCPFRIEGELSRLALLLGRMYRDKVGTYAAGLYNFVCNTISRKAEMAFRLLKRGIDDRIFYNDRRH